MAAVTLVTTSEPLKKFINHVIQKYQDDSPEEIHLDSPILIRVKQFLEKNLILDETEVSIASTDEEGEVDESGSDDEMFLELLSETLDDIVEQIIRFHKDFDVIAIVPMDTKGLIFIAMLVKPGVTPP